MHYIRFLKTPKLEQDAKGTHRIRCLITITTDLGEAFYPCDIAVMVVMLWPVDEKKSEPSTWESKSTISGEAKIQWHAGMRQLAVDMPVVPKGTRLIPRFFKVRLSPCCRGLVEWKLGPGIGEVHCGTSDQRCNRSQLVLPPVLGLFTSIIDTKPSSASLVHIFRPLPVTSTPKSGKRGSLDIREAATIGRAMDPISSHVWDAAVALIPTLERSLNEQSQSPVLALLQRALIRQSSDPPSQPRPSIVELGTGCAPVSCALYSLLSNAYIRATDQPVAKVLAEVNIQDKVSARRSSGKGDLMFTPLDWDNEEMLRSSRLAETAWDVIIASDCTYNPDSTPALVNMMQKLSQNNKDTLVLVAMKTRHVSEASFHPLMKDAGFIPVESEQVLAPVQDDDDSIASDQTERIDIICFGKIP